MTNPTPTPQTPPQGLTDERLLELAAGKIEFYDRIEPGEYEAENECALEVYGSELIAVMRAAIAAHEAARVGLHCYLDDDGPCPSPCVFDDPAEQISNCTYAQGLQRNGEPKTSCPYYRPTPTPTPEALQAAYAAWFKAEQGIPPSPAAARTAAAFASAVLRGEVQ